jgi:hypothetical protein
MTMSGATVDLSAEPLTPAEATAKLAEMKTSFNAANGLGPAPSNPPDALTAQRRLEQLSADPKWSAAYLAGDQAARAEFNQLCEKVAAGGSNADFALAGIYPDNHTDVGEGASLLTQLKAVPVLRDAGLSDGSIRQILEDETFPPEVVENAKQLYRQRMRDQAWQNMLLDKNHPEHRATLTRWTAMCAILVSANVNLSELR